KTNTDLDIENACVRLELANLKKKFDLQEKTFLARIQQLEKEKEELVNENLALKKKLSESKTADETMLEIKSCDNGVYNCNSLHMITLLWNKSKYIWVTSYTCTSAPCEEALKRVLSVVHGIT
ncbi:MAG: hypothetical protein MJA29_06370, partial [Candidatus Omnitrophica bacterium]|nr:hypothetical protein [Candidatus Omnitrophota bacterium]